MPKNKTVASLKAYEGKLNDFLTVKTMEKRLKDKANKVK